MSAVGFFAAARAYKREITGQPAVPLTQDDVNALNAATVGRWKAPDSPTDARTRVNGQNGSSGLSGSKGPLVAIIGAVAATSLFATIPKEEGLEYKAYRDIAGIWTICSGDTKDVRPGLVETPEACRRRLESQLVAHARPVMECTPALAEPGRDYQRAAAVSLAYNIGVKAYCHSTVDRKFDGADWRAGCDAFLVWSKARVNGQLRVVQGLLSRRQRERAICLKGLPA
jgi:lysozyme